VWTYSPRIFRRLFAAVAENSAVLDCASFGSCEYQLAALTRGDRLSRGGVIVKLRSLWRHGLKPGSPAAMLFAVACVAAAILLQELAGFDPDFAVFAPYYAAVLIATIVAGWSAGALATCSG
jgi:hypothetical protein